MHKGDGKRQITASVAVSEEDVEVFKKLCALGVELEIRRVPSEKAEDIESLFG